MIKSLTRDSRKILKKNTHTIFFKIRSLFISQRVLRRDLNFQTTISPFLATSKSNFIRCLLGVIFLAPKKRNMPSIAKRPYLLLLVKRASISSLTKRKNRFDHSSRIALSTLGSDLHELLSSLMIFQIARKRNNGE